LVAPGDPKALAVALDRVLADPGRGATMGRAGRRRVEERFAWERIAERTLVAYEVCSARSPRGSSAHVAAHAPMKRSQDGGQRGKG
jgi:hypothetical protein